jgi:hypothetical protein
MKIDLFNQQYYVFAILNIVYIVCNFKQEIKLLGLKMLKLSVTVHVPGSSVCDNLITDFFVIGLFSPIELVLLLPNPTPPVRELSLELLDVPNRF